MATDKTVSTLFIKRIFQLLVSVGGFAYIFYKIPLASVAENWSLGMTPWILATLVAATLIMAIQANRWKGLSAQGPEIPFKTYYAYTAMGYFFNNLLPERSIQRYLFNNLMNSISAIEKPFSERNESLF